MHRRNTKRTLSLILTLLALTWALWDAWRRAWHCDDAFISFRYALHLAEGDGLVYNAGERVEGYTNFAWTILVALGDWCGLDPLDTTTTLGLLAFAGTLWLLAHASRSMQPAGGRRGWWLPLAALGMASTFHARIFATSGLETSLFTLLATATLVFAAEARTPWAWGRVAILGVLCSFTRPDGLLFLGSAAAAVFLLDIRRRRYDHTRVFTVTTATLLGPYLIWKLAYYGALLPNTFHAKSAGMAYWEQGWRYLFSFFSHYPTLALTLLAIPTTSSLAARSGEFARPSMRQALLWGVPPLLFLIYVARVGGDFMFARFCVPVVPLLLLNLEALLVHLRVAQRLLPALAVAVFLLQVSTPIPEPAALEAIRISDEWGEYPPQAHIEAEHTGQQLRALFGPLPVRVVIYGYQAMLAYYARFPYVVEGTSGLTEPAIARQRLQHRGRPGHEKKASPEYLRSRGVHFLFDFRLPLPPGGFTEVDFGPVGGRIITYDRTLMAELATRGVRFLPIEELLDGYLAAIDTMDPEDVGADFGTFKDYYFDHNDDPAREQAFLHWLEHRPAWLQDSANTTGTRN